MSLLTLTLWVAGIIVFLAGGIALLPDGDLYPLPDAIITATQTLYIWLYSFNQIFPVDTLAQVLFYGVLITVTAKFVWPSLLFIFNKITRQ